MDSTKFDAIARLFGSGLTRREALRGLVAGATGITAGGVLLQMEDASAGRRRRKNRKKNRRKNRKKNQQQCGKQGDGCGAYDADTGTYSAPYCCHGYECVYITSNGSSSWTCQPRV
ncbi:MAG: hypothetical protein KY456_13555 [Chloroflexi bacterium]|nr:hypothetical protein [Chloroflexota bacterium]